MTPLALTEQDRRMLSVSNNFAALNRLEQNLNQRKDADGGGDAFEVYDLHMVRRCRSLRRALLCSAAYGTLATIAAIAGWMR